MRTMWTYLAILALCFGPHTLIFRGEAEPFVLPLWLSVSLSLGTALWIGLKIIEDRQEQREHNERLRSISSPEI